MVVSNRVLKEFKDTDATQVEWARSFVAILNELHDFVKRNHTTGLTWNPKGGDASGRL
jgi:adenylyl cyclase-associated protein